MKETVFLQGERLDKVEQILQQFETTIQHQKETILEQSLKMDEQAKRISLLELELRTEEENSKKKDIRMHQLEDAVVEMKSELRTEKIKTKSMIMTLKTQLTNSPENAKNRGQVSSKTSSDVIKSKKNTKDTVRKALDVSANEKARQISTRADDVDPTLLKPVVDQLNQKVLTLTSDVQALQNTIAQQDQAIQTGIIFDVLELGTYEKSLI